jgi:hypothetical protein
MRSTVTTRNTATKVLITAAVALVGLTGCGGGTSSPETSPAASSPATGTATGAPTADITDPALQQAQSDYLAQAARVGTAYGAFYDLYDSGSTDLPALQGAATDVSETLGNFAAFVRDYDWPASVPADLPATIYEDYTTREGGMDTWAGVAAATSLDEMKERLKETGTPEATTESDAHTDALRDAIGLPPSDKSSAAPSS